MTTNISKREKILPPVETDVPCARCGSHLMEVPWNTDRFLWYCAKEGCPAWHSPQGGRKRPREEDEVIILPMSEVMHPRTTEGGKES